ncbi:Major capsid protein Gp5 [uncultured Caudovirales phage]|jgi:hypothetical protein|uniref:Major capsid protein Gp5 n=1 Tax=uncultured Caudovirales phage TaxID=2100421 RepID=A0A6J5N4V4_9CAUD|nr:Major capsid protein Gp5 [uncultured Caudovirales phage]
MANTILQPTTITRAFLKILHNKSALLKRVNRQYDNSFGKDGAKIGDTLKIRRPVQYTVRSGRTYSAQDVQEYSTDLTVATQRGVDFEFNSDDLTLKIEDFSERYLVPAAAVLATNIDYTVLAAAKNAVANLVGTRGTTPATLLTYLQAGAKLDYAACPRDGYRYIANEPNHAAATVDGLKGLFQSSSEIASQYEDGMMGRTAGFEFSMSQNLPIHTVGPLGGTPLVNGGSQSITTGWAATASLITDGWTAAAASRVKAGDVFTIANVYSVNAQTKVSTGQLQQFVITADGSSDGSGNLTLTVSPAIITGGAYQNVNSVPADNAALTFNGTASTAYTESLAFHKGFATIVTADLILPKNMDMAARETYENVSARFVRGFDITNDKFVTRMDVLFGYAFPRPEWACRITG